MLSTCFFFFFFTNLTTKKIAYDFNVSNGCLVGSLTPIYGSTVVRLHLKVSIICTVDLQVLKIVYEKSFTMTLFSMLFNFKKMFVSKLGHSNEKNLKYLWFYNTLKAN